MKNEKINELFNQIQTLLNDIDKIDLTNANKEQYKNINQALATCQNALNELDNLIK